MKIKISPEEILNYHEGKKPGKFEIRPSKPLLSARDLSLAYTPGVALPCLEIQKNPADAYRYTTKGNTVAVISNGTAVLGLGNIGALASKPVMEGKSVLFKKFADIDSFDLEVSTENVDEFVNCVKYLGAGLGGINLEDIKAPECFMIEEKLKAQMDIPIFHDDQHGTAICMLAGLLNALELSKKSLTNVKIVINGAGAASIASSKLLAKVGVPKSNLILVDRTGVIYKGRKESMNVWKEEFANDTDARTLAQAAQGADILIGLSSKQAFNGNMVKNMAKQPIIFAMANPDPEITPEDAHGAVPDAIVATGRSDYPNQVNNALCFPYLFRGALDVQATEINDEMKIAAAKALAALAKEPVPEEVALIYADRQLTFGKQYIIPVPFDPRLMVVLPVAVAKAAMETGVAKKPIHDLKAYAQQLKERKDPTYSTLSLAYEGARKKLKRIIFAEGEEEKMIRAAVAFHAEGLGKSILLGREEVIQQKMQQLSIVQPEDLLIHNAAHMEQNQRYADFLYERGQSRGLTRANCQKMVHQNNHIFGGCMLHFGLADGMVTGLLHPYDNIYSDMNLVLAASPNKAIFGLSLVALKDHTLFVADTAIHEVPTAETLAGIALQSAEKVKYLGYEPHVAFLGSSKEDANRTVAEAIALLKKEKPAFTYTGPVSVETALNKENTANILIMPDLQTATISTQLLAQLCQADLIGPILIGLEKPVQIVQATTTVSELVALAVMAAKGF